MHNASPNHCENRLDRPDALNGRTHVVGVEHRDISEHAGRNATTLVFRKHKPSAALRPHAQCIFALRTLLEPAGFLTIDSAPVEHPLHCYERVVGHDARCIGSGGDLEARAQGAC